MHTKQRLLTTIVLLSAAFLLCPAIGSAGKSSIETVRDLHVDPGFTPDALVAGKMCIGGVTSTVETDAYGQPSADGFGEILRLRFLQKRTNLAVQPEALTRHFLGEERYAKILQLYNMWGKIESDVIGEIGAAFDGAVRYVVFARVIADRTTQRQFSTSTYVGEEWVARDVYKRTRYVTVQFVVCDLQEGTCVWTGAIPREAAEESEYAAEKDEDRGILARAASHVLFGDNKAERDAKRYPEYPTFEEVVTLAFNRFIRVLPEEHKD